MQRAEVTIVHADTGEKTRYSADKLKFSPYKCFPLTGEDSEIALINRICQELARSGRPVTLYHMGRFLDFILDHAPFLIPHVTMIVDEDWTESTYRDIPCATDFSALPAESVVFVCEAATASRWRLERNIPPGAAIISPDIARTLPDMVPEQAWIPEEATIYPFPYPDIRFDPDLDVLLLDLPSAAGLQIPVSVAYVHKALKRSTARFQTFDAGIILYHRFQIHRLFDLGHDPTLRNGAPLTADAWGYNERAWVDPRLWPFLLDFFAEDIDEIVRQILIAKPKVLAMSIHQRNEWITRHVARRVKLDRPDTLILIGGHSCYTRETGAAAFPDYDYMVVGEADLVVGPLVEALARGERPTNMPGVASKFDAPEQPFIPGPAPHNLDIVGGLDYDATPDVNALYRSWNGQQSTAIPLTRGCVWSRCSFCAERFSFRSRSPEKYVDELQAVLASGRNGAFSASDSDFGGQPSVIHEVCEEIVRRGLKLSFSGQIRVNKEYDYEFFKLMRAAGIQALNFGADAFTENTIRRQNKGYTLDTVIRNYTDCHRAGIRTDTNIVTGTPGETDDDITNSISFIAKHRDIFHIINNINCCELVNNSVYWHFPEKHGIYFYGNKDDIFKKYRFGVPQSLWYSVDPFMDKTVRFDHMRRMVLGLNQAGVPLGREVIENFQAVQSGLGHMEYRAMTTEPTLAPDVADRVRLPDSAPPSPPKRSLNQFVVLTDGGQSLAFDNTPGTHDVIRSLGRPYWWQGTLHH